MFQLNNRLLKFVHHKSATGYSDGGILTILRDGNLYEVSIESLSLIVCRENEDVDRS